MILISLDSGLTTGVAVINGAGELLHSQNIDYTRIDKELTDLQTWFQGAKVIAERAPAFGVSQLGVKLNTVQDSIRAHFPEAVWLRSAEWLGSAAKSYTVPRLYNGKKLSPHQKDSYRMALWYLKYKMEAVNV